MVLIPILAMLCVIELVVIVILSACLVTQRHTKQDELNTIIAYIKTRADGFYENTSGFSQRTASMLYGFVDRLREL